MLGRYDWREPPENEFHEYMKVEKLEAYQAAADKLGLKLTYVPEGKSYSTGFHSGIVEAGSVYVIMKLTNRDHDMPAFWKLINKED